MLGVVTNYSAGDGGGGSGGGGGGGGGGGSGGGGGGGKALKRSSLKRLRSESPADSRAKHPYDCVIINVAGDHEEIIHLSGDR